MNIMKAFMLGSSGVITDYQMQQYHQVVSNNYQQIKGFGGSLSTAADEHYGAFNDFVNSRAWELSAKLAGKNAGENVGRFDIGRLVTVEGLQGAQTMMRDYIMAMPGVMDAHLAGDLSGYNGEISGWCSGTGEDNLYYRRQMHGVVGIREHEGRDQAYFKHYHDSVAGIGLSARERFDLAVTRHAVNHHMAKKLCDFTSPTNDPWGGIQEEPLQEDQP